MEWSELLFSWEGALIAVILFVVILIIKELLTPPPPPPKPLPPKEPIQMKVLQLC